MANSHTYKDASAHEASDLTNSNPFRTLELLAPAGRMACLHAAVSAGANAVYLGCEDFNARRGADNFTLDTLQEACDYAHLRGVKIYLTLNIAVMPDEAKNALELARQAYRRGVDAFIVQDIGVAAEIVRTLPDARVHISTQMNTHNVDGVQAAAALGASRVTLARELTLAEVSRAAQEAHALGMSVETFGHGALCVCYSGQCFMSSLIGGRSANRGMCAQACRLPYTLHNAAVKNSLPSEGDHLLSPKDLCTVDMLCDLVQAGVDSVKIEGRMKSPEYVSTVVGVYRAAIDRLAAAYDAAKASGATDSDALFSVKESGEGATDEERRALSEAFSRGFTQGYLKRHRGNDIMSYRRPNNRGVFVGRVTRVSGREALIESTVELHEGDVLEFWTNKGHFAVTVDSSFSRKGREYRLNPGRKVAKGDRVFRVRDASLAFKDDSLEPRVAVDAVVTLHIGEPLTIDVAARGVCVRFEGDVVEAARTKAITLDDVSEHIDRVGNTPFRFETLQVELDEGVGLGFSTLHKARAQALAMLQEALLEGTRSRHLPKAEQRRPSRQPRFGSCRVMVLATNPACARAAKRAGADAVYVPALNLVAGEACSAGQINAAPEGASYPKDRLVVLPVVDKPSMNAEDDFDPWSFVDDDAPVMVESLGQLHGGLREGRTIEVGPHVPVTNALTLDALAEAGASRVWLSPELSLKQIEALGGSSPVPLGLTIAGYQELMVTEHCLLMSQGPCDQRCGQCARRKSPHFLEDRKGYQFQVVTDLCGRSHLYNAVRLDAIHLACDLIAAGVSAFMVDTTLMNVQQTTEVVSRAVRARDIALKGDNRLPKAEGCTTGHLFRGVS
ncbi:DUF3656 domain-containing protein [uncultured Slackia sp.]|uniref:DUF3656 domain-containing U32 family peptidase n=1 Tax=uncultured Slackia sp. TaxID=665903 RepID=UPI00345BAE89